MLRGRLDRLHLGDLFEWLRLAGARGWLTLAGSGVEARFMLREGRIAFASSSASGERLGAWLARRGLLEPARLYPVLLRSLLGGRRLTALLVEAGLVAPDRLRSELAELTVRLLRRLLVVEGLEFRFEPADPEADGPSVDLDLDLDPSSAVLEAARRTDENGPATSPTEPAFPVLDEEAERVFWELVERAYPDTVDLSGPGLAHAHRLVRDAVGTLGQWLRTSPGLVPMPPVELGAAPPAGPEDLVGRPHLVWNLLVLAWALPDAPRAAATLPDLARFAAADEVWLELRTSERWLRPVRPRLDAAVEALARDLATAAAAAAGPLGADPCGAALAAHLYVVPAALVLYVLATIPIPAEALRRQLLLTLAPRLGRGLARRAALPEDLHLLLGADDAGPLAAAVAVARSLAPNATLLPEPATSPSVRSLVEAKAAAREALGAVEPA